MINCLLICTTIFGSLVYILHWAKQMSKEQLPHFVLGHLEPTHDATCSEKDPIGFAVTQDDEPQLSDVELRNKTLEDMASTYTAILRGEFDLDELGK